MTFNKFCFVFLLLTTMIMSQDFDIKVNLLDGSTVSGQLLKISSEGVDIDPEGAVTFRFIAANRIESVEIIKLNRTFTYPLNDADIPQELSKIETDTYPDYKGGFPDFLLTGSFNYSSVGDDEYYEGFHSGSGFRLGMYYLFRNTAPGRSRLFLGFSYNQAKIDGDEIYGFEPKLDLKEYSLEMGITTNMFDGGHYLYLLMGFVIVSNEVSIEGSYYGASISESFDDTQVALRIEGGGSIALGSNLSLIMGLGYDLVLGKNDYANDYYYDYNQPKVTVIGGILNLTAGISYGL